MMYKDTPRNLTLCPKQLGQVTNIFPIMQLLLISQNVFLLNFSNVTRLSAFLYKGIEMYISVYILSKYLNYSGAIS